MYSLHIITNDAHDTSLSVFDMCFFFVVFVFYDIHIFDIHPGVCSRVQTTQ